jgi:C-terminal processing protease CtpA/Prc
MKAHRFCLLLGLSTLSCEALLAQAPADANRPEQKAPEQVKPAEPPEAKPQDHAQDKPKQESGRQEQRKDGDRVVHEKHHRTYHFRQGDEAKRPPAMRPTTYLGISTRTPSPEARALTGVAEGLGLVVEEVMPDCPAKVAGLQRYDLLTQLDDQLLVNPEQLSTLVRMKQKDASVTLTLKRAGVEQKVTVKLGEKMMLPAMERGPVTQFFDQTFNREDMHKFTDDVRENMQRFGREMDQWRERMKDQWQDRKHGKPRQDKSHSEPKHKPMHERRPDPQFREDDEA